MRRYSDSVVALTIIGLATAAFATTRVRYSCLDPGMTGDNRLSTNGHIRTVGGGSYLPGAPIFCSVDVTEIIVLNQAGNSVYSLQLNSPQVTRVGSLQHSSYESASGEYEFYSQTYSVGGKQFTIGMYLQLYPNGFTGRQPNSDWIRSYVYMSWPNGVPAAIDGHTTQYGVGLSVKLRPYFYHVGSSDYDHTMVDAAGCLPLWAMSLGAQEYCLNVTPGAEWGNTEFKTLGLFSYDLWRTTTAPLFDLQWVESGLTDRLHVLHAFNARDNPVSMNNWNTLEFQSVSYGGSPQLTQLPPMVLADDGDRQCYILGSLQPNPSTTGWVYAEVINIAQRCIGKRSIGLEWYAYSSQWADPDYKHTGPGGGANNSVRDVLQSLLWGTGSDVDILTSVNTTTLRCSNYGNFDNICTDEELVAIEYATNPGSIDDLDYRRLDAAAYVLAGDQKYWHEPPGIAYLGISYLPYYRAFVFPRTDVPAYTKSRVYIILAHELGHLFGMQHQWSECSLTDNPPWDCPGGTIMSYSSTYKMQFNYDCVRWFYHAPREWVDPRWGWGATDDYTVEPSAICNWVPPGQW